MLALFLILACAPTDPVEACVRLIERNCECGFPSAGCTDSASYCSSSNVLEAREANCYYDEMADCYDSEWDAAGWNNAYLEAGEACGASSSG